MYLECYKFQMNSCFFKKNIQKNLLTRKWGGLSFLKNDFKSANRAKGVPIVEIYLPLMKNLDRIMSKNFLSLNVNEEPG